MSHIKDSRLWRTCLLTVVGTALFGMSFHGALGTPGASGKPLTPGTTVQAPQHPFTALTDTSQEG